MTRLSKLKTFGQRFWLDELSRSLLQQGEIRSLAEREGLAGVTTNPSIFQKAISGGDLYDETITNGLRAGKDVEAIYQDIAVEDVCAACDQLHQVYLDTQGEDGYVSLEVSPHLAYTPEATIAQAEELWRRVDRPNLFIKVPGTREAMSAVEELLYRGINLNITLLFGLREYRDTFQAYARALKRRAEEGKSIDGISSVASFFLSRIDVAVDELLEGMQAEGEFSPESLRGKAAVANAKLAYAAFQDMQADEEWAWLRERGAQPQRIVWASTSTKDPDYSDVMYVDPLIGPDTISTMPWKTAEAYNDHGSEGISVSEGQEEAQKLMEELARLGIDFDAVTDRLVEEGVDKFIKAYDQLLADLREKRDKLAA